MLGYQPCASGQRRKRSTQFIRIGGSSSWNQGLKISIKSILGVTLIATMLAGCATMAATNQGENQSGQASREGNAQTLGRSSRITICMLRRQTTPINLDGPITQEVMKKSGVHWDKSRSATEGDLAQQINLKLVAGDFPGRRLFCPSDSLVWSRLIDEKKLLPLDEYFNNAAELSESGQNRQAHNRLLAGKRRAYLLRAFGIRAGHRRTVRLAGQCAGLMDSGARC